MLVDYYKEYRSLFGSWFYTYFWNAYTHGVNVKDIPLLLPDDKCVQNTRRLEKLWKTEVQDKGVDKASFLRVCFKFIKTRLLIASVISILKIPIIILSPLFFMRNFIEWLTSTEEAPLSYGITMAICFIICEFMKICAFLIGWAISDRTGGRLRAACFGLLYQKILKTPDLGGKCAGEIINLFANDGQRIYDFAIYADLIPHGPIVVFSSIIYILMILGPSSLIGIFFFLLFCPLQMVLARMMRRNRKEALGHTDTRVRLITEIISSIKLIKMNAWEQIFADNVKEVRAKEEQYLRRPLYVSDFNLSLAVTYPVIAVIMIFLSYTAAGNNLTAAEGLPILAVLVGPVRIALNSIRISTRRTVEAIDSFKRLQIVLLMDDRECYVVRDTVQKEFAIELKDVTFAYSSRLCHQIPEARIPGEGDSSKGTTAPLATLPEEVNDIEAIRGLTLHIRKGSLVGICGGFGAGKTSLLLGILDQMKLLEGTVHVSGSCAYVSQQAWLLNTTLRENILMGSPFVSERYHQIIHDCCLNQDIASLPGGSNCEIGERGINLSGGQKQRISLARALYADRDVYLLDDPLSAVDPPVGRHIFQWAIQKRLQSKTVIFFSHQLQYFVNCDQVILMKEGRILEAGTHTELVSRRGKYCHMFNVHMKTKEDVEKKYSKESASHVASPFPRGEGVRRRRGSARDNTNYDGTLMKREETEGTCISTDTYRSYVQYAGGYLVASLVLLSFVANIGASAFSSWWLAYWLSHGSGRNNIDTNVTAIAGTSTKGCNVSDNPELGFYQLFYGLIIVLIAASSIARGIAFTTATLRSSSKLHNKALNQILQCPMTYFDSTASGQIINLFSTDMKVADDDLPSTLEDFLQFAIMILSCVVIVSCVFPCFIPVLLVIGVAFSLIWSRVRKVIINLERLENASCSPIYSHLNTTANGVSSILAYGKEKLFLHRLRCHLDKNNRLTFFYQAVCRWVSLQLILLSLLIVVSTTTLSIILKNHLDPTYNALAVSYIMQINGLFHNAVRLTNELEAKFASIDRLFRCIKNLTSEGAQASACRSIQPKKEWPMDGRISFKGVYMRYRPRTPFVLKGVSFEIEGREKIGIVGRTGSGKSSLGAALFRLVELSKGSICIDSINIDAMSLKDLRSRLSVIPQDPILFSGNIRNNLDPFDEHTETDVWKALDKTFMKPRILRLDKKLSSPVVENGQNFSVGERQLLCLARALLRNSKIIFLDEATAGIDSETDSKIQKTLQRVFSKCTVLTVAHRLKTVMSSSRILVLEGGEVIEFDTPSNLSKQESFFSKLLQSVELDEPQFS